MARAFLGAVSAPGYASLATVLRDATVRILQSTLRFGSIELAAEQH